MGRAQGGRDPIKKWRQFTRRTALTGGAAAIAALASRPAAAATAAASTSRGVRRAAARHRASSARRQAYKFTFVNHVTTNPFFTPTQYGIADACKLLGCSYQWTGSTDSDVSQMVNAMNSAIAAKADGIAVALIDLHAFNAPTDKALAAGIPVVAYNADAASNDRLAYIGQDLFVSGAEMGKRIVAAGAVRRRRRCSSPRPGSAEHPAADRRRQGGAQGRKAITIHTVATGAAVPARAVGDRSLRSRAHQHARACSRSTRGSTQSLAQVIQKHGLRGQGLKGGGYDLTRTDAEAAAKRLDRIHDRPAALPAGLPPGAAAVPVPGRPAP